MSDGDTGADAATHGHDADDIALTGTPLGSRGAAPWERFGTTTQTVAVVNRWVGPSALDDPVDPDEPLAVEKHDNYDAYALPSPAEYNYDLPDLDAIHRGRLADDGDVEQTTVLPKTSV